MNYIIYDAHGQILQSNKVLHTTTDWRTYEDQMREFGHDRFIRLDQSAPIDPRKFFVNRARVRPRGAMPIVMERGVIRAGDAAVFRRVPKIATCNLWVFGAVAQSFPVDDGELEQVLETPGVYRFEFLLFPYMPWSGEVIVDNP